MKEFAAIILALLPLQSAVSYPPLTASEEAEAEQKRGIGACEAPGTG